MSERTVRTCTRCGAPGPDYSLELHSRAIICSCVFADLCAACRESFTRWLKKEEEK